MRGQSLYLYPHRNLKIYLLIRIKLSTPGEYIKKNQLERGSLQREVTKLLGTWVKLYRKEHKLSMETFCLMGHIDINVAMKLENLRFCKLDKEK